MDKIRKYLDISYYIFLVVVIFRCFMGFTTLETDMINQPLNMLSYALAVLVLVKVIIDFTVSFSKEDMVVTFVTVGLLLLCNMVCSNSFIFEYCILVAGAKNIKAKSILKVFFIETLILTAITVLLCITGNIQNIITYRNDESTHGRMGLGFVYATCFTSQILAIAGVYAFLRNKKLTVAEDILFMLIAAVCYYLCEARISCFCIFLLGFLALIFRFTKLPDNLFIKLARRCMIFFAPVIAFISIVLGIMYEKESSIWNILNKLSSERLSQNGTAFSRYSLSLFGQSVSSIGSLSNGQSSVSENYFVINTSYVSVLFKMGFLALVAVLLCWVIISFRYSSEQNYYRLCILFIFAVFFFFEHRIFEFTNNPFLLLLIAASDDSIRELKIPAFRFDKYLRPFISGLCLALLAEMFIFNFGSIATIANDEVSFADCAQKAENVYFTEYETLKTDDEKAHIMALGIPTYIGLNSVYLDINQFEYKQDYRKIYDEYTVDIYDLDADRDNPVKSVIIDPKKQSSFYVDLNIPTVKQNLLFDFSFSRDSHFAINYFIFNGTKPFEVSFVRLLILAVASEVICLGYIFLKKEKISEKR